MNNQVVYLQTIIAFKIILKNQYTPTKQTTKQ